MRKMIGLSSFLLVLLLGANLVGCQTQQADVPRADAGRQGSADAYLLPEPEVGPNSGDVPSDQFLIQQTRIDTIADTSDSHDGQTVGKEDLAKEDAREKEDAGESDLATLKVDLGQGTPPEVLSDISPDVLPDVQAPIETPPWLGSDAASLPKDVSIYLNRDKGGVDIACNAGTDGWIGMVATLMAESRWCWGDDDCMSVSFGDECGQICPVPLNKQRVGEFSSKIYGHAKTNCATCPTGTGVAPCMPPVPVYCNYGHCEFLP